jgi:hypothetical protein
MAVLAVVAEEGVVVEVEIRRAQARLKEIMGVVLARPAILVEAAVEAHLKLVAMEQLLPVVMVVMERYQQYLGHP